MESLLQLEFLASTSPPPRGLVVGNEMTRDLSKMKPEKTTWVDAN